MGRPSLVIEKSNVLSQILFLIEAGHTYPKQVSDILQKPPSVVNRQFQTLFESGFISLLSEESKQFNQKDYAVNYDHIVDLWFKLLTKKAKNALQGFKELQKYKGADFKNTNIERCFSELIDGTWKSLSRDKILRKMFQYAFGRLGAIKPEISIQTNLEALYFQIIEAIRINTDTIQKHSKSKEFVRLAGLLNSISFESPLPTLISLESFVYALKEV